MMAEFVEVSDYDPPTSKSPNNFTNNPPTNSPTNFLSNKYVVIGVLTFFVTLFLLAIILHLMKSRYFCRGAPLDALYAQVSSEADTNSLTGSDDDNLDSLYTSCQLYVADDDEVDTGLTDDFEYDCSSLDGGLSVPERTALVSVLRGDFKSNVTKPTIPHIGV